MDARKTTMTDYIVAIDRDGDETMSPDDINSRKQHEMQKATHNISEILHIIDMRYGDDAVVSVLSGLGLRRKQKGELDDEPQR